MKSIITVYQVHTISLEGKYMKYKMRCHKQVALILMIQNQQNPAELTLFFI